MSAILNVLGMNLPANAACTNPATIPAGFAAPCPVFAVSPTSVSQAGTLTLSATPQAGTDYIYTTAYISQGTAWNPYTLTGNNAVPNYSSALASLTLSSAQLSSFSLGTHYTVVWDWLWDTTAQCYKGPGLNQCNTGQWRVQSFTITATYAYSQSSYYSYSQATYYGYSQSAYYVYSQAAYGSGAIHNVKTECGATGNGSTDDTNAINTCIGLLVSGDTLLFPAGTYKVTSLNAITVSNVTVDGSNSTATVRGNTNSVMTIGTYKLSASPPLTATATELSTTISANWSAIGVAGGDYIYIEQGGTNDGTHTCGGSGCRGKVLKMASVSGTTGTVTTAVHQTYNPPTNLAWLKKVLSPISGLNVHDLIIDGSNTAVGDLMIFNTVNSTFTNLIIRNVIGGGSGIFPALAGAGLYALVGFNNSFTNMTITGAGSTSCANCGAIEIVQQGNLSINGLAIHNLNAGPSGHGTTGFNLDQKGNGTLANVNIDATGTGGGAGGGGRPIKLNSATYSTFNSLTVSHSEGNYLNGLSLEYFSQHNIFNDCSITNLNGTNPGIQFVGDSQGNQEGNNSFNTFNNCTINNTTERAVWILDTNIGNEFNGGTYSGISGYSVFAVDSGVPCCANNTYIHNVTISGPGTYGIEVMKGSIGACINSNTFSPTNLSAGINVSSTTNKGSGNILNGLSSNLTAGVCP